MTRVGKTDAVTAVIKSGSTTERQEQEKSVRTAQIYVSESCPVKMGRNEFIPVL